MAIFESYENTFPSINDMAQSLPRTVSPQELMMPAPGSSQFSFMDTPDSSLMDSPAVASSAFNTTPLHDGELDMNLNYDEFKAIGPLFPQDEFDQFGQIPVNSGMQMSYSPTLVQSATATSPMLRQKSSPSSGMVRQKSSPGRPPILGPGHGRKPSLTSGINKPSRPRGNLVPIEITSDDDKDSAKRKKNTAAARKSRQRKNEASEIAASEIQRLRAIIYGLGADPDDTAFMN